MRRHGLASNLEKEMRRRWTTEANNILERTQTRPKSVLKLFRSISRGRGRISLPWCCCYSFGLFQGVGRVERHQSILRADCKVMWNYICLFIILAVWGWRKVTQIEAICILRWRRKKRSHIKARGSAAAICIFNDARPAVPGNIRSVCLDCRRITRYLSHICLFLRAKEAWSCSNYIWIQAVSHYRSDLCHLIRD